MTTRRSEDPAPEVFVRRGLSEALWQILTYIYVAFWVGSEKLRNIFIDVVGLALLVPAFLTLFEAIASCWSFIPHMAENKLRASGTVVQAASLLPELPPWLAVFFLILAVIALYHRVREFAHKKKESLFAKLVGAQLDDCLALDLTTNSETDAQKRAAAVLDVLDGALYSIHKVLVYGRPKSETIGLTLMKICHDPDKGRILTIHRKYPPDRNYVIDHLPYGNGKPENAAATALDRRITMYVPCTYFTHGIGYAPADKDAEKEKLTVVDRAFSKVAGQDFRSVICAPVKRGHQNFGVLNIDSSSTNAFRRFDIRAARAAAGILAIIVDKI